MDIEFQQNPVGDSSKTIEDCILVSNDLEKNLLETDLCVQPQGEKMDEVQSMDQNIMVTESNIMDKVKSTDHTNMATESKTMDEFQSVDQTRLDTGSTEDLTERNSNDKRKRRKVIEKKANINDETQCMDQKSVLPNLHLSNGNECTAQIAGENANLENVTNELNDEIIVYQGKCPTQVSTHLSSPHMKEAECLVKDLTEYPRVAPVATIRRKLLVLDVNGLLANIVMPAPKHCRGDTHIYGRAIFKRPFCDDFLKFCFQNFDVAVWSSRSRGVIIRVVDYLLGDLKDKLLFCWDMDHSTKTGYKTLENYHKPLVFKELRRIWENDGPNLTWKKGDYDESNTLLLDDSPYKALLNPLHTAIFPNSYHFEDKNDNSLGPGGDLRVYLEGLLTSENVQKYVQQHPFGQSAINETNLQWGFYSGVLQTMFNRMEPNAPSSLPSLSFL